MGCTPRKEKFKTRLAVFIVVLRSAHMTARWAFNGQTGHREMRHTRIIERICLEKHWHGCDRLDRSVRVNRPLGCTLRIGASRCGGTDRGRPAACVPRSSACAHDHHAL
eukprot:2725159-Pleurochrysis_carterae.AAC.2